MQFKTAFILLAACVCLSASLTAVRAQTKPPDIKLQLAVVSGKAVARGRTAQATVTVDIPAGYHVNANKPLSRFAIPTKLTIETPPGVRVRAVLYPRAVVRRFSFSDEQLGVYAGRAVIRITFFVPAKQSTGDYQLNAKLYFQSCSEEACFPPVTREISAPLIIK